MYQKQRNRSLEPQIGLSSPEISTSFGKTEAVGLLLVDSHICMFPSLPLGNWEQRSFQKTMLCVHSLASCFISVSILSKTAVSHFSDQFQYADMHKVDGMRVMAYSASVRLLFRG